MSQPPAPIDYDSSLKYPAPYSGPAPTPDEKTMGMLAHLLAIFTGFIGPLIIWLIKKDQSAWVSDQGKEALNFQIACAIAAICCFPLFLVFGLGILLLFAVQIARLVLTIMATIQANNGVAYRYPINLRLIK